MLECHPLIDPSYVSCGEIFCEECMDDKEKAVDARMATGLYIPQNRDLCDECADELEPMADEFTHLKYTAEDFAAKATFAKMTLCTSHVNNHVTTYCFSCGEFECNDPAHLPENKPKQAIPKAQCKEHVRIPLYDAAHFSMIEYDKFWAKVGVCNRRLTRDVDRESARGQDGKLILRSLHGPKGYTITDPDENLLEWAVEAKKRLTSNLIPKLSEISKKYNTRNHVMSTTSYCTAVGVKHVLPAKNSNLDLDAFLVLDYLLDRDYDRDYDEDDDNNHPYTSELFKLSIEASEVKRVDDKSLELSGTSDPLKSIYFLVSLKTAEGVTIPSHCLYDCFQNFKIDVSMESEVEGNKIRVIPKSDITMGYAVDGRLVTIKPKVCGKMTLKFLYKNKPIGEKTEHIVYISDTTREKVLQDLTAMITTQLSLNQSSS
jgi:hypothetical protein